MLFRSLQFWNTIMHTVWKLRNFIVCLPLQKVTFLLKKMIWRNFLGDSIFFIFSTLLKINSWNQLFINFFGENVDLTEKCWFFRKNHDRVLPYFSSVNQTKLISRNISLLFHTQCGISQIFVSLWKFFVKLNLQKFFKLL